jgi:tripartite ATP-independent transporter DctP family solute receptor
MTRGQKEKLRRNKKMQKVKGLLIGLLIGLMVVNLGVFSPSVGAAGHYVFKLALTDSPELKVGDVSLVHHSYAAMVAFKTYVEKATKGRMKVELYPYGRLGDCKSNLEQILAGTLQGATPPDGNLASFYKNIQVFSIPYLFSSREQAYKIIDGKFGKNLFDDMAKKSGLRVLSIFENGGFRSFSNNKRVIRTAADMKGLKFRVMDIPVHMEMVKALGATPTPVAWMELYSALQTGVVDGQENSALTIIAGSLQEVQKYYTLDNHFMGTAVIVTSERWMKSLPKNIQRAMVKGGIVAEKAARETVLANEKEALAFLKKSGMTIYTPTPAEMKTFKRAQAPCIKWLKKNIDPQLVDQVMKLAK